MSNKRGDEREVKAEARKRARELARQARANLTPIEGHVERERTEDFPIPRPERAVARGLGLTVEDNPNHNEGRWAAGGPPGRGGSPG